MVKNGPDADPWSHPCIEYKPSPTPPPCRPSEQGTSPTRPIFHQVTSIRSPLVRDHFYLCERHAAYPSPSSSSGVDLQELWRWSVGGAADCGTGPREWPAAAAGGSSGGWWKRWRRRRPAGAAVVACGSGGLWEHRWDEKDERMNHYLCNQWYGG